MVITRILGGIVILSLVAPAAFAGDSLTPNPACDPDESAAMVQSINGAIASFKQAPALDPATYQDLHSFNASLKSQTPYKSNGEVDAAIKAAIPKDVTAGLAALRAVVDHANEVIKAGLEPGAGPALTAAIGGVVNTFPVRDNYPTIQSAVAGVAATEAFGKFAPQAIAQLEDVEAALFARCSPVDSFAVKSQGHFYGASRCAKDDSVSPVEVKKAAGEIAAGHCRLVISCDGFMADGVLFADDPPIHPILDCKLKDNRCPVISACAREVDAGQGSVHVAKPEAAK